MSRERGVTFLELIVTASILAILASAILPLGRVTVKRQKELELRRSLRILRAAIDRHKLAVDRGEIGGTEIETGNEGYPADLEALVEGVSQVGAADADARMKFLRRIPVDPMTGEADWGLRCYQDRPDSRSWCRDNVYDVYSRSDGVGLDGVPYREW